MIFCSLQRNRGFLATVLCLLIGVIYFQAAAGEQKFAPILRPEASARSPGVASFQEAMAARKDIWGEAAIAQPNGPSYEYFKDLLLSPRYVNADFRYYPIPLSAPNAKVKARLISNGSGINLRGGASSWNDPGTSVTFRVGPDGFLFGGLPERLSEPELVDGYLPIAQIHYWHPSPFKINGMVPLDMDRVQLTPEMYELEAFASTDPVLAESGVVFVRFTLLAGTNGILRADLESKTGVNFTNGTASDGSGKTIALFQSGWKRERGEITAHIPLHGSICLAVATKSLDASIPLKVSGQEYDRQRQACINTWREILGGGMNVETHEPYVNNAWRHLLVQNFELINGNVIHYSSGNQYDKLYESEGSDAALAFLVWGFERDTRRLIPPLMDFTRKGLEFHQAGFKLNDVYRYYWQTRDKTAVDELQERWSKEAKRLANNRTGAHGLFPKQQYCGDISTPVQSVNDNTKAWRALRDLAPVLAETGRAAEAEEYAKIAADFKKDILEAIHQSARRETSPPFVPVALFDKEPIHDPICHSRIGGYWNIIIGYTIGSGIFPTGSEEENWIPHYQEQHGGLCMGMLRAGGGGNFTFWNSANRINPLYGTRYALDTLRRDDTERALVSFYGMLAQGFTRNTFICGEGCSLDSIDPGGRLFYCPPNSAANAHFLSMLRYLLVQDQDTNDDGKPDTLRLMFATPRRWLEDGKQIKVERAPTAFGPVSVVMRSRLNEGKVTAEVALPARNHPSATLLRARVPDGWSVTKATVNNQKLAVDPKGTIDLTSLQGRVMVEFSVAKK
jgi:hypothetical protein